jgi:hypothetical protein
MARRLLTPSSMKLRRGGILALVGVTSSFDCSTVEAVHRPPTPVEIAHINDVARESGSLAVDVLPRSGPPSALMIHHVSRGDGRKLELVPEKGAAISMPLDEVTGFTVHRGARGAAIGAGIGASVALFEILGIVAAGALLGGASSDPGAPQSSGCDSKCAQFIVGTSAVLTGVGALVGAVIGSPRRFPLNLGPATNP